MENCEIYITGIKYQNQSWADNIDDMLQLIYEHLNEIPKLQFVSINATEAEVFNVNLKVTNYESMLVYLKGVKYKNQQFVSYQNIQELELKIKNELNNIQDFQYDNIEIRSSKIYLDVELGLTGKNSDFSKSPQILETH